MMQRKKIRIFTRIFQNKNVTFTSAAEGLTQPLNLSIYKLNM